MSSRCSGAARRATATNNPVPTSGRVTMIRICKEALVALAASAVALVALVAAAGGASAATAGTHGTAVTGMTWHALSLRNGWRSDQATYQTGNPAWAVSGGIVYLAGSLHQASGSRAEFAVLPPAARPAHDVLMTIYTLNGSTGTLHIQRSGPAYVTGNPRDPAREYASLAGVSFPAAKTAVHKLTLANGWEPVTANGNGIPSYVVIRGIVHLAGALHLAPGTDNNDQFGVLPRAARPANYIYMSTYTAQTIGIFQTQPTGGLFIDSYNSFGARQYTSLGGIVFPAAATPVHKLSLLNGWHSHNAWDTTGDPSYAVIGGVV